MTMQYGIVERCSGQYRKLGQNKPENGRHTCNPRLHAVYLHQHIQRKRTMHTFCRKPLFSIAARRLLASLLLPGLAALPVQPAHAELFADNEARRAILDLRQRYQMIDEENAEILANQQKMQKEIDTLRGELSRTRTREEQLARDIAELQRRQKEQDKPLPEERTAPASEANSGSASPNKHEDSAQEKAAFDAALQHFRSGNYTAAQTALRAYLQQYPQGSRRASAQYWLGNSDYALRNYRSAISNFRAVVSQAPEHERAPEALLSLASCHSELNDTAAARSALEQIITKYPRSEAALAAKDRLARLR